MRKKNGVIKTFLRNREYIFFYARVILKTNVAGSYLGFLWLFISPLMFMLIYSFIVLVVFKSSQENFNVFVLIGLTSWSLFSNTVLMGATAIVRNKSIFEQVYFHKSIYPMIYLLSNTYQFLISFILVIIFLLFSKIPLTWHVAEMAPVLLVQMLFTLGCTLIISHFGVYVFDLRNVLDFVLRFLFYLSPVMWNPQMLNPRIANLLQWNPMAVIINAYRACLMYHSSPNYLHLLIITLVSCVLIFSGHNLISKYEDEYARTI